MDTNSSKRSSKGEQEEVSQKRTRRHNSIDPNTGFDNYAGNKIPFSRLFQKKKKKVKNRQTSE